MQKEKRIIWIMAAILTLIFSVVYLNIHFNAINAAEWQGEDYYYYSGGKLTAKAGSSTDVQYTTYLDYSLIGGCEISFKLDFPTTTLSEGVFFGIYSIKDPTQKCMTQGARITFSLSSKSFSLFKNGNRSALLDPSDWIDYSRFTNAGYTMQGKNLFRMTVTPEGETKLYLKSMLSGAQEIQVGYYKKLFSQEIVNNCWFGYSMYLKGLDWDMSDIMIKDAAGQIVFADDFSLLESSHYIYGSQIAALISNGSYVITQGTQKKYLDIDLSAVPVNAVKGSVTDFTPVTAGSGVLTITAVPEQGEPINITADGEGRFKYAFLNEGAYVLNYTYTDTEDSSNFISDSLEINVFMPAIDVSSVSDSCQKGEAIDLTPVISDADGLTLSVKVNGNVVENYSNYVFNNNGKYIITYGLYNGEDLIVSNQKIVTVTGALRLSANIADDILTLTYNETGYQYQFWIKELVSTDGNDNLNTSGYIWKIIKPFSAENSTFIDLSEGTYISEGKYHIILRVKDNNNIIREEYVNFSQQEIGKVVIETVSVDGARNNELFAIDKAAETLEIAAEANIDDQSITFSLIKNDTVISQNTDGKFNIDISGYKDGYYDFYITAENDTSFDMRMISIYVFGDYKANEAVVIESLTGVSNKTNGMTEYKMKMKYADGNNIDSSDIENLNIILKSDGKLLEIYQTINDEDGVLTAIFNEDYNSKYGVRYLRGEVSRDGAGKTDDYIIDYYSGYVREGSLSLSDNDVITAGNNTVITATGNITGYSGVLKYAFYREDASGWVLIKDYSESPVLEWKPLKQGMYNIMVRMKAEGQYSYEKQFSKTYTVNNILLSGSPQVKSYEVMSGNETAVFAVGVPYRFAASYDNENVLYMFTVYNANWGNQYICKYSPDNDIIFIPNKTGTYIITARIIHKDGYGYKEISKSITFSVI